MGKSILLVTANDLMLQKCIFERGPTNLLRVRDCATLIRYITHYKDADEIWYDCDALGTWDASELKRTIYFAHPQVKVIFIAATLKEIMVNATPRMYWKLVSIQLNR
jgi:hypothetical protein